MLLEGGHLLPLVLPLLNGPPQNMVENQTNVPMFQLLNGDGLDIPFLQESMELFDFPFKLFFSGAFLLFLAFPGLLVLQIAIIDDHHNIGELVGDDVFLHQGAFLPGVEDEGVPQDQEAINLLQQVRGELGQGGRVGGEGVEVPFEQEEALERTQQVIVGPNGHGDVARFGQLPYDPLHLHHELVLRIHRVRPHVPRLLLHVHICIDCLLWMRKSFLALKKEIFYKLEIVEGVVEEDLPDDILGVDFSELLADSDHLGEGLCGEEEGHFDGQVLIVIELA
mmetsp:Transcript_44845/g.43436  ORF Transcript_44845/g.43436 Transcript_44845/m.43436 type:complete len:280 (-) Transcript_44845:12-851(-)